MEDALEAARRLKLRLSVRQLLLSAAVAAVLVGVAAGLYISLREDKGESVRVLTGVQSPYPEGWVEQPLTDDDRAAGFVLKVDRQDPQATFLARAVLTKSGERRDASQLSEQSAWVLSMLVDDVHLITNEIKTIASVEAVQLTYRQTAEADANFETLVTVLPLPNRTFYLTMRAPAADYGRAEPQGIQLMDNVAADIIDASQQQQSNASSGS